MAVSCFRGKRGEIIKKEMGAEEYHNSLDASVLLFFVFLFYVVGVTSLSKVISLSTFTNKS